MSVRFESLISEADQRIWAPAPFDAFLLLIGLINICYLS